MRAAWSALAVLMTAAGCAEGARMVDAAGMDAGADGGVPTDTGLDAACLPGFDRCGGSTECIDLRSDSTRCGRCDNACAGDESCVMGACVCSDGRTDCGGGCVDLATDVRHCGRCGLACRDGELCMDRACYRPCDEGLTSCGGECVDTLTDVRHCNGCDMPCMAGDMCADGMCFLPCPMGQTACGRMCVDTMTDEMHCGGCAGAGGSSCPTMTEECLGGRCVPLEREWRFGSCGLVAGALGPSQALCDGAYAGTTLAGDVTVSAGIQRWTVPATGAYRIEANGAQGVSAEPGFTGGRGARIAGVFMLNAGDVLSILVGQQGTVGGCNGGGGGGSFVIGPTGSPLVVAGGGGGTRQVVSQNGCDGRVSQEGGTGSMSLATHSCAARLGGVRAGGIVSAGSWGSGGGGMDTAGGVDTPWGDGGDSHMMGGSGGVGLSCTVSEGGFGGGGSGNGCCGGGGGGGYSGGEGGRVAGGGGSFNGGMMPEATAGASTGPGTVVIQRM